MNPQSQKSAVRRAALLVGRAAFVLGPACALGLSFACTAEGGDRAAGAACPTGEICSAATPNGLQFVHFGTETPDDDVEDIAPTAVLGIQRLAMLGAESVSGVRIVVEDRSVATARLERDGEDDFADDVLVVEGHAAGSTVVRVVDTAGALLDRLTVHVAAIDDVQLVEVDPPGSGGWMSTERAPRLVAGQSVMLRAILVTEGGVRIVDDGMRLTSGAATTPSDFANEIQVQVPADGAGDEIAVRVAPRGGEAHDFALPIVAL